MLQGNEPKEAEEYDVEQATDEQEWKTQAAAQRSNLHAKCYGNDFASKAR